MGLLPCTDAAAVPTSPWSSIPRAARAVTIATRYTAVRRQTAPTAGERELQVLE